MSRRWQRLSRHEVLTTPIFSIHEQLCRSPRTGLDHPFFLLETADWVNVIPITDDEQVVMVRQYRHGRDETTLEIPGGMIDPEDADPAHAARRELLEETGFRAGELRCLGAIAPNPAVQTNLCHTFVATGLQSVAELSMDVTEDLDVLTLPLAEVPSRIASGEISHALVVVAFCFYLGLGRPVSPR
ncbi:MAG: NUDIX hydrolase [Deltaproteobacteria bacterium]|nr:NUDIX hydrolase [Deltaproteobacteria bacterium]